MRAKRYIVVAALMLAMAAPSVAQAQPTYSLGIYAPTAPFASSDAVRSHAEALGKAIEHATKARISVRVYFRLADLQRARPHLAVVDARCAIALRPAAVLAGAVVNGSTNQRWGLYGNGSLAVPKLSGEKILVIQTGCSDDPFVAHGLLGGELPLSFFGPRIGRRTAALAAEALRSGIAKAAFLPAGVAKGFTPLYRSGSSPGPLLIASAALPGSVRAAARRAAVAFTSRGGISGYRAANRGRLGVMAAQLKPRSKRPVLAPPSPFRLHSAKKVAIPWGRPSRLPVVQLVK